MFFRTDWPIRIAFDNFWPIRVELLTISWLFEPITNVSGLEVLFVLFLLGFQRGVWKGTKETLWNSQGKRNEWSVVIPSMEFWDWVLCHCSFFLLPLLPVLLSDYVRPPNPPWCHRRWPWPVEICCESHSRQGQNRNLDRKAGGILRPLSLQLGELLRRFWAALFHQWLGATQVHCRECPQWDLHWWEWLWCPLHYEFQSWQGHQSRLFHGRPGQSGPNLLLDSQFPRNHHRGCHCSTCWPLPGCCEQPQWCSDHGWMSTSGGWRGETLESTWSRWIHC